MHYIHCPILDEFILVKKMIFIVPPANIPAPAIFLPLFLTHPVQLNSFYIFLFIIFIANKQKIFFNGL